MTEIAQEQNGAKVEERNVSFPLRGDVCSDIGRGAICLFSGLRCRNVNNSQILKAVESFAEWPLLCSAEPVGFSDNQQRNTEIQHHVNSREYIPSSMRVGVSAGHSFRALG
jgi:hypothetical protein